MIYVPPHALPLECADRRGQEGIQRRWPVDKPPALLPQWHHLALRSPHPEVVAQPVEGTANTK